MKLIVGLGNPGRKYAGTRHNVGWWVVDHLADVWHCGPWRTDHEAVIADGRIGDHRVRLLKPQTFMNLSGAVLRSYVRRLTWSAKQDLLVVVDEVALPLGSYRVRSRGSAGGHNGLKDVERAVGHQEYARLRIGIAPTHPEAQRGELSDFVLGHFGKGERDTISDLLPRFEDACDRWVRDGIIAAMNAHNGAGTKPAPE